MKCPKCEKELVIDTVDQRKRRRCQCGYLHYEPRGWTNGIYSVLDVLADAVANNGCVEEDWEVLVNCVFRNDENSRSKDKMIQWCNSHGFLWEGIQITESKGNLRTFIRFRQRA